MVRNDIFFITKKLLNHHDDDQVSTTKVKYEVQTAILGTIGFKFVIKIVYRLIWTLVKIFIIIVTSRYQCGRQSKQKASNQILAVNPKNNMFKIVAR